MYQWMKDVPLGKMLFIEELNLQNIWNAEDEGHPIFQCVGTLKHVVLKENDDGMDYTARVYFPTESLIRNFVLQVKEPLDCPYKLSERQNMMKALNDRIANRNLGAEIGIPRRFILAFPDVEMARMMVDKFRYTRPIWTNEISGDICHVVEPDLGAKPYKVNSIGVDFCPILIELLEYNYWIHGAHLHNTMEVEL